MTALGTLAPGDVGYYVVDWSQQLAAVSGDTLSGNLTVESELPDLEITNIKPSGSAAVSFNASSDVAALYRLTARAAFSPSGRKLSQTMDLMVGLPPAVEPISLVEARQHLRLDTEGNPPAHPDDQLVASLITGARQTVELDTGLTLVTRPRTDYRDAWEQVTKSYGTPGWGTYPGAADYLHYGDYTTMVRPSFLLEHAPVISVDEIRYLDPDGNSLVLDPAVYRVTPDGVLTRIEAAIGQTFPAAYYGGHAVIEIDYTCGFETTIDEALRSAIKLLLTIYYENRGVLDRTAAVPQGYSELIDPYRVL
jgi:hypothetical protein